MSIILEFTLTLTLTLAYIPWTDLMLPSVLCRILSLHPLRCSLHPSKEPSRPLAQPAGDLDPPTLGWVGLGYNKATPFPALRPPSGFSSVSPAVGCGTCRQRFSFCQSRQLFFPTCSTLCGFFVEMRGSQEERKKSGSCVRNMAAHSRLLCSLLDLWLAGGCGEQVEKNSFVKDDGLTVWCDLLSSSF